MVSKLGPIFPVPHATAISSNVVSTLGPPPSFFISCYIRITKQFFGTLNKKLSARIKAVYPGTVHANMVAVVVRNAKMLERRAALNPLAWGLP